MPTKRQRSLGEIGESKLIAQIRSWLGDATPPPPQGIGDDCAILAGHPRHKMLVTVDPVIRGHHFTEKTAPSAVARKLLNRNISDIAAMGGTPRHAVIAVAAPPDLSVAWLRNFYRSLSRKAIGAEIKIVGGDCSQTAGFLGAFLTLIGEAPRRPLTRTGAKVGDLIYVSGSLGGSILGKHMDFTPRLKEGQWLAGQTGVHAAIDVSDGFGKDAPAIIPEGMYCEVNTDALPASAAARRLARKTGRGVLDCVLNDGEDYELLFSVSRRSALSLETGWRRVFDTPLTKVGQIKLSRDSEPALVFNPPLPSGISIRGYEHFR